MPSRSDRIRSRSRPACGPHPPQVRSLWPWRRTRYPQHPTRALLPSVYRPGCRRALRTLLKKPQDPRRLTTQSAPSATPVKLKRRRISTTVRALSQHRAIHVAVDQRACQRPCGIHQSETYEYASVEMACKRQKRNNVATTCGIETTATAISSRTALRPEA